jgi:hypothetical protein
MRSLITIGVLLIALSAVLGACSNEHGELLDAFPLPTIHEARMTGPESVTLNWDLPDAGSVEEYRVYVGVYANLGYTELDEMQEVAVTTEPSYLYSDPLLDEVNYEIDGLFMCDDLGLCDSLFKYTYFRVSAVRGGAEGVPGPRIFAGW